MDKEKTTISKQEVLSKGVDSRYNLPIALIGMITHGYAKGHYGHFILNVLWPYDTNIIISSISIYLHNLERIS